MRKLLSSDEASVQQAKKIAPTLTDKHFTPLIKLHHKKKTAYQANTEQEPAILSIAGSDPSGGAGIQADIKTFSAIGVFGCAAITCLTAQNTKGVVSCQPVEPNFVRRQIELVLEDLRVTHIKIGMVGAGAVAAAINAALTGFEGEVICDPILAATGGQALFNQKEIADLLEHIIDRATVITPNLPELKTLTGHSCRRSEEALTAARTLFSKFTKLRTIIIKGGHLDETSGIVTDYLMQRVDRSDEPLIKSVQHPRIATVNTHGTGCTFASAFAAFHLLTGDDEPAFRKTVGFMDQLLGRSSKLKMGHGHGPLFHHL